MMAFTAPSERERQVGYLRVRFLSKRFRSLTLTMLLFLFRFVHLDDGF